jgi:hypothetical protein
MWAKGRAGRTRASRNSPMWVAPRGADEKESSVSSTDAGPLSRRDYPLLLEAVALDEGGIFIHFTYAYSYGLQEMKPLDGSSHM